MCEYGFKCLYNYILEYTLSLSDRRVSTSIGIVKGTIVVIPDFGFYSCSIRCIFLGSVWKGYLIGIYLQLIALWCFKWLTICLEDPNECKSSNLIPSEDDCHLKLNKVLILGISTQSFLFSIASLISWELLPFSIMYLNLVDLYIFDNIGTYWIFKVRYSFWSLTFSSNLFFSKNKIINKYQYNT